MDTPITGQPVKKFSKLNLAIFGAAGVLIVALFVLLLSKSDDPDEDLAWTKVRFGDLEHTSPGIGRFVSTSQRVITTQESGTVKEINANVGEPVQAGESLVVLANPQLENELNSTEIEVRQEQLQSRERLEEARREVAHAEIEVSTATVALETAQAENEMNAELFESDVISKLEFVRSESRVVEAEKRLEGSRLELTSAREHLERQSTMHHETRLLGELRLEQLRSRIEALEIKAPEDGLIKRLDIRLGDNVSSAQPLAEIGPQAPDGARLRFPQRDLEQLQPGVPVSLRFLDQTVEGRIVRVLPDLIDGMVTAEVQAGSLPENARIDMAVRGDALLGRLSKVLFAPLPATPGSDGTLDVLRERNGNRERIQLQNVRSVAGNLVFGSGVKQGDRLTVVEESS
ncbi:MAG: HlyD family efflux transporter periplasmic adaptor subunit [Wenzhouxiangellaceae bacterium]